MAFVAEASIGADVREVENSRSSLIAGLAIAAAVIAMAASSYVGSLRFSPSFLTVSQTQFHSSRASLTASKSGASSSSTFAAITTGTIGAATLGSASESEGMISSQAAANAFDNLSR